jgi:hypothetical protein
MVSVISNRKGVPHKFSAEKQAQFIREYEALKASLAESNRNPKISRLAPHGGAPRDVSLVVT